MSDLARLDIGYAAAAAPSANGRHDLDASKVTATSGRARTALSPREWEVAWLVARGHTNRQIAAHLYLSEKTVERHLSRIFGKLEITARASLATYVTQQSAVIALRA